MNFLPLLQIEGLADTTSTTKAVGSLTETTAALSVWDLALKGGWVMLVLALLSVVVIYIFIQKILEFKSLLRNDNSFVDRVADYVHTDRLDSALDLCRNTKTCQARIMEKGLMQINKPLNEISLATEIAGNIEIGKLQRWIPILATITAAAPMIGFLGTVTGMVRAFFDLANAGTAIDISLLSGGIYEALVTTIGGLIVGIIALFALNIINARIDQAVNTLEATRIDFIDIVNKKMQKNS